MTAQLEAAPTRLMDLVAGWARNRPTDVAIVFGDAQWNWQDWNERILCCAGGLVARGVGRGGRVAVLDKNHPATLEITFAAASLGAATAIANWRLASAELLFMLNDCAATVLFVGSEFLPVVAAIRAQVPSLEHVIVVDSKPANALKPSSYETFLATAKVVAPAAMPEPDDVALLMYSSGTTGHPKGVMLSQRALTAHTMSVGTAFPFTPGDRNLVAMPLFHVGGVCYALIGIRAGVPSIMTREPDAASLISALNAGATHAFFVPPIISAFLAAGETAVSAMAALHYLGYGAAPMPLPLLEQALTAWPDVNFVQVYGQTELSGSVTVLTPADHRDPNHPEWLLSAGRAVPGCEIRVVDLTTQTDTETGQQGELWFRTAQRMTGYLNQSQATADTISRDGWVRTGDIGRVDRTGHVYVEDRLKDMIITGGENVYGPEVERVLIAHPAVVDAAIIGIPDEHWGEAIHAILVTSVPVTEADIVTFCRQRLAAYKCPRTVEFVDSLPRNASGKILKRELRSPYWADRPRTI